MKHEIFLSLRVPSKTVNIWILSTDRQKMSIGEGFVFVFLFFLGGSLFTASLPSMVTTRKKMVRNHMNGNHHHDGMLESPVGKKLRKQEGNPSAAVSTPHLSKSKLSTTTSPPTTPFFVTSNQVDLSASSSSYLDLRVTPKELRPSATLTIGQCFHWKPIQIASPDQIPSTAGSAWGTHDATDWVGVLRIAEAESVVIAIKETSETTLYRVLHGPTDLDYQDILRQYFQLDCQLEPLYEAWSRQDPERLAKIAKSIIGVRLVLQDPWECLISFICSSNNNIPRITKMLSALRHRYGSPLMTILEGEQETVFFSFPSLKELKEKATEADLRTACGMGYRAKYIMATIDTLESLGGETFLHELRKIQDPIQVQQQLMAFAGVGRKVADCVALFSLCQAEAIPVDTHVWNICRRDYDDHGMFQNVNSLTPTIYKQVGDVFRAQFTPKAGWAHTLLFVAELPSFRPLLEEDMVAEMDQVSWTFSQSCC